MTDQSGENYSQDSDFDSSIFSYDSESEESKEAEVQSLEVDTNMSNRMEREEVVLDTFSASIDDSKERDEAYLERVDIATEEKDIPLSPISLSLDSPKEEKFDVGSSNRFGAAKEAIEGKEDYVESEIKKSHELISERADEIIIGNVENNNMLKSPCPMSLCVQQRDMKSRPLSSFIIRQDPNNLRLPKPPSKVVKYSTTRMKELSKPRPIVRNENGLKRLSKVSTHQSYSEFIERQEYLQKSRRKKVERLRAEREYLAKPSKKRCPQCNHTQSFDEFVDGRDSCPIDGTNYLLPCTFNLRAFEKRMFKSRVQKQQMVEEIREERRSTLLRAKEKSYSQRTRMKNVCSNDDFLVRMADDMTRRKKRAAALTRSVREEERRKYSFRSNQW